MKELNWKVYSLIAIEWLFVLWVLMRDKLSDKIIIFIVMVSLAVVLTFFGRWLNILAIYLNNGKMPVWKAPWHFSNSFLEIGYNSEEDPTMENRDNTHAYMDSNTRIKVLCDIIPIPIKLNIREKSLNICMASAGDFLQWFSWIIIGLAFIRFLLN